MIDIHSHILPGLDDGARDMESALAMARIALKDGITTMVATPHLFRGGYTGDHLEKIEIIREQFREELKKNELPLDILPGVEVHISHNLIEKIKEFRDRLVLNHSSYIFVEFPSDLVFPGVKDLFFDLMSEGLTPVITHPERNSYFRSNPGLLHDLLQMGALAQANRGSFFGLYGDRARSAVHEFLELNFFHFIATDCHSPRSSAPVLSDVVGYLQERRGIEKKTVLSLVRDNPQALIDDREIPFLPDPIDPGLRKKSMKIKLPGFLKRKSD